MSNYFIVNKGSNLIQAVVSSNAKPKETRDFKPFIATEGMLNLYYSLKSQLHHSELVDIGSIIKHANSTKLKPANRSLPDLTEKQRINLQLYIQSHASMTDVSIANVFHVSVDAVSALRP